MVLCQLYFHRWFRSKLDFRKLSSLLISGFLDQLTFLSQNWCFLQKDESSLEEQRAKETSQTMLVIIFWHFLIVFLRSQSPQVKRYLTSSIANSVHKLPHELSNDLRVRILGNQEILATCQMWGETQPSAQSSFQKQNLDNSSQKICKNRFYFFEVLSNFTVFLQFVRNILASIV